MGTRCTAGGDDAGDVPKKRSSISLKGSDEPKGEPNAIDMSAPDGQGDSSTQTRCPRLRKRRGTASSGARGQVTPGGRNHAAVAPGAGERILTKNPAIQVRLS